MKRPSWVLSVLIAIDQLVNAALWGWPDETLSSRSYRMGGKKKRWTIARWCIDKLFFWQKDHCRQAYESERAMHHHPVEARL